MECNCRPIKTIFISSITTTATGVVLIPSTTITASKLFDLNKYRLIIQCNLRATANLPVYKSVHNLTRTPDESEPQRGYTRLSAICHR